MSDVKKVAQEYGEKMKVLQGQFVGTADRLAMAFLAGAAWQREQDVAILLDQYERCQPGTLVSYHIAAEVLRTTASDVPTQGDKDD